MEVFVAVHPLTPLTGTSTKHSCVPLPSTLYRLKSYSLQDMNDFSTTGSYISSFFTYSSTPLTPLTRLTPPYPALPPYSPLPPLTPAYSPLPPLTPLTPLASLTSLTSLTPAYPPCFML